MKEKKSPLQKMLNVWAISLIVWSLYRYFLSSSTWVDEVIAKPIIFILPVLYFIVQIEKSNILEALWIKPKEILKDLIFALVIGLILIVTVFLAFTINHHSVPSIHLQLKVIFPMATLALITAISEEILSRGFIVKRLFEDSKNIWSSSVTGSILFFILYLPALLTSKSIHGNIILVFMIMNFMLGFANSLIFLYRKSLTASIFINAIYSFIIMSYVLFS